MREQRSHPPWREQVRVTLSSPSRKELIDTSWRERLGSKLALGQPSAHVRHQLQL